MHLRMLHEEASGSVSYLLADLEAGEAVVIDPRAADVPVLLALLSEHRLRLRRLLRTHEHDTPRRALDREALAALQPVEQSAPGPQEVIPFGDECLHVLNTPGHTLSCLSFRWRDRLFCGGLLQVEGCRHQPWPACPEALWDSVTREVFTLPPETLLFSGLANPGRAVSTVLEERRWHPWFGAARRDEFMTRVAALPHPPST